MDELVGYCAWEAQTLSVWLLNQNQDSAQLNHRRQPWCLALGNSPKP